MMRHFYYFLAIFFFSLNVHAQIIFEISFEDFGLAQDTFWHCKSECNSFEIDPFEFESKYDPSWGGFWSGGFAVSTMRNDTTEGFTNLFSAIPGEAANGITYLLGQNNAGMKSIDHYPARIRKISITNTTYAYRSMKNGDSFAKKFGGATGNDPDYFKIRIYGTSANIPVLYYGATNPIDSIEFYLADFRDTNNVNDYIIDDWIELNIDSLFVFPVGSLMFKMFSSDTSQYGINTPAFFALDKLEYDILSPTYDTPIVSVELFPSITQDDFNLRSPHLMLKMIDIFDSFGNLVYNSPLHWETNISLNHLRPGIYFVKIQTDRGAVTKKLIKI